MRPLVCQLLRRVTPRNGVWFVALVVSLFLAGVPAFASPSFVRATPSESAPPVEEDAEGPAFEVRESRQVPARPVPAADTDSPHGAVPVQSPSHFRAHVEPAVPFWHGLVPRLRC